MRIMTDRVAIITGGSGFIGRHTLRHLLKRGFKVHIVSRGAGLNEQEAQGIFGPAAKEICFHRIDLHDSDNAAPYIQTLGASHLLHLGWETTHGEFWNSPRNIDWIVTSKLLLQAFIDGGGTRVVAAGTCAEYDWATSDLLLREDTTRLLPHSLFGQTKQAFRKNLVTIAAHHKVSAAWGRIFFLFGPHEDSRRLVPATIRSLLKGERVNASKGDHKRDFLLVDDVAAALVALLDSSVEGDVNIASGKETSVAEILTMLGEITERPDLIQLGAKPTGAHEPQRLIAAVDRLQKELEYNSQSSLREGLEHCVKWWKGRE